MPAADSNSSATDEILDHSDNPLVTPVRTLASDHSHKPGFVAGMITLAVIVVAAAVTLVVR